MDKFKLLGWRPNPLLSLRVASGVQSNLPSSGNYHVIPHSLAYPPRYLGRLEGMNSLGFDNQRSIYALMYVLVFLIS